MLHSFKFVITAMAMLMFVGVPALRAADSNSKLDSDDQDFVEKAASAGLYEVQASQLAIAPDMHLDQATMAFAKQMITDHGKANDELKALAMQKGVAVKEMNHKHSSMLSDLKGAKADKFAQAYRDQQVAAHKEAVDLFTKESQNAKDADLKAFAAKTLPILEQHLAMIQGIQKGGAGGTMNH